MIHTEPDTSETGKAATPHGPIHADQTTADTDQTTADADQTTADTDQAGSERDDADAASDQIASDKDQASADKDRPHNKDAGAQSTYAITRATRQANTVDRLATHATRAKSTLSRADTASQRDATSDIRDEEARRRDVRAREIDGAVVQAGSPVAEQFEQFRARAATDRARAAADRASAASDRAAAAVERSRLEAELLSVQLDDLTGTFRRKMGRLALDREIDRARRGDGRFVLAFVDVDGMKGVNDGRGHAAGDEVLRALAMAMRSNLRSFDPIVRHGGDEFVCGLGGVDLADVAHRFEVIDRALRDSVGVGISIGLAAIGEDETLDEITARADAALLEAKGQLGR